MKVNFVISRVRIYALFVNNFSLFIEILLSVFYLYKINELILYLETFLGI